MSSHSKNFWNIQMSPSQADHSTATEHIICPSPRCFFTCETWRQHDSHLHVLIHEQDNYSFPYLYQCTEDMICECHTAHRRYGVSKTVPSQFRLIAVLVRASIPTSYTNRWAQYTHVYVYILPSSKCVGDILHVKSAWEREFISLILEQY